MMVIEQSGVQCSIKSYNWFTKSDICLVGVGFVLAGVSSEIKLDDKVLLLIFIITMTKFLIT